jgi:hypothetical protein
VYEITKLPGARFERFVKKTPVARFLGRAEIKCASTNLTTILDFQPYDAEFAERTGVRGNIVSGVIVATAGGVRRSENGAAFESADLYREPDPAKRERVVRVLCGSSDGDVESISPTLETKTDDPPEDDDPPPDNDADPSPEDADDPPIRVLIRGLFPYENIVRGGFDARRALRAPGSAMQKRFWHAAVDAIHARDLREPLNSVKYELLQPLRACAAKLILGFDEKYVGAETKKTKTKTKTKEAEADVQADAKVNGNGNEEIGRRMRYECALLLTGALPEDAPGPLPRFWDPQPTRRFRRPRS